MKFEMYASSGTNGSTMEVHDNQVELWSAAFDADLAGLFDTTPAATAIPVLDAAIARFLDDPDSLRTHLAADDWRGLRGNRLLVQQMRDWLATYDGATVSSVAT